MCRQQEIKESRNVLLLFNDLLKDDKGEKLEVTRPGVWKLIKEIPVIKIKQDDPIMDVFRDVDETYYATTKYPG